MCRLHQEFSKALSEDDLKALARLSNQVVSDEV
jgi:hypothetical protein